MTSLVHRAEMSLLGLLIRDPDQLSEALFLLDADFATRSHQEVFAAINEIIEAVPGISGPILPDLKTLLAGSSEVSAEDLDVLAHYGADAQHPAAVYARMIQEAAIWRDLRSIADRLDEAAGPARGADPELDHLAALSSALETHTSNLENAAGHEPEPAAPSDDPRAAREEQLLAALIQNQDLAAGAALWLDPGLFTSPVRRELYEGIIAVTQSDEPVVEMTIFWELARMQAMNATLHGRTIEAEMAPVNLLARLVSAPAEIAAAVEIGRELLADHVRAEVARDISQLDHSPARPAARAPGARAAGHDATPPHARTRQGQTELTRPPEPELGHEGPQLRQ